MLREAHRRRSRPLWGPTTHPSGLDGEPVRALALALVEQREELLAAGPSLGAAVGAQQADRVAQPGLHPGVAVGRGQLGDHLIADPVERAALAQEAGQAIKLVGIARRGLLEVGPKLVPMGHPLAVGGTLNAVTFELDLAREISIAGFGAGPKETSSSLLGDLIDVHHTLGG